MQFKSQSSAKRWTVNKWLRHLTLTSLSHSWFFVSLRHFCRICPSMWAPSQGPKLWTQWYVVVCEQTGAKGTETLLITHECHPKTSFSSPFRIPDEESVDIPTEMRAMTWDVRSEQGRDWECLDNHILVLLYTRWYPESKFKPHPFVFQFGSFPLRQLWVALEDFLMWSTWCRHPKLMMEAEQTPFVCLMGFW